MNIANMKINFLGDSITEGAGASDLSQCYVERIASDYGAICRNYGIGGTRIAVQRTPSTEAKYDQNFISRVDSMDQDADIVLIFGGTNDFGHGDAPLGKMTDRTPTTFYGAMHTLCQKLLHRYSPDQIIMATPIHRLDEDNPYGEGNKQEAGAPLASYVAAIKEVAAYYALSLLDLYQTSGIQPNEPFLRERYTADGLHPNDAGHALLAKRIAHFIHNHI